MSQNRPRRWLVLGLAVSLVLSFIIIPGRPARADAPVLLAHTAATCGGSGCTAVSPAINGTGATLLVMTVQGQNNCQNPANFTVSDSNGNTWHHTTSFIDCSYSGIGGVVWYSFDHNGSPLVTGSGQTFSIVGTGVSADIAAFSGTQTGTDPLDKQTGGRGTGNGTVQPGSITPAADGELIYSGASNAGGDTPGSRYSVNSAMILTGSNTNVNFTGFANSAGAYLVQTTAGAINPTWTIGGYYGISVMASFKAGSSGGSAPIISSFSASPSTITSGDSSILSWSTSGASSLSIAPGSFSTTTPGGSHAVSPGATTVYTLTATNANGSVTANATVTVNTSNPPVISNIQSSAITSSGATITWSTDVTSDSQVDYGTSTSYGFSSVLNSTLVTSHSVPLSGLAASTLYHFRVKSAANSNLATSGDNTFTTLDVLTSGQNVTWTKMPRTAGWPGYLGWFVIPYDPLSQQAMFFINNGGIYSSQMSFYNTTNNAFSRIPGDGSTDDTCMPDLVNLPGARHPDGQLAVDTKRNQMWMFAGVEQNCGQFFADINGTSVTLRTDHPLSTWRFPSGGQVNGQTITFPGIGNFVAASVQDPTHLTLTASAGSHTDALSYVITGTETSPRQDMYYLKLNQDSSQSAWQQVTPAHLPTPASAYASSMVYDSDDDVLFAFGNIGNWVYCPTSGTSILTNAQKAAGCDSAAGGHGPDDWTKVTPTGLTPPGSYFPQMEYDTQTHKVIQYGGVQDSNNNINYNQTWAYDVPTHAWTQKALGTTPPPPFNGTAAANGGKTFNTVDESSSSYDPVGHKVFYHQISNIGAPADWQYDPSADTWTKLAGNTGPGTYTALGYDPAKNTLVAWVYNATDGFPDIWQGSISNSSSSVPTVVSFTASPTSVFSGQSAALSWSVLGANSVSISPSGFTSTSSTGSITVSPTSTTTYTLTAANSNGSATRTATVTFFANQAPVVNAGSNQAISLPTSDVTLTGSASDDGLPNPPAALTYIWTQVSGPVTGNIVAANATTTQVTGLSQVGSYIFQLAASDGELTATSTVSVTVNPAGDVTPPTIAFAVTDPSGNPITATSTVLGTVTFTVSAGDPLVDGQTTSGLKLIILKLDGVVVASSSSATLTYNIITESLLNTTHNFVASALDNAGNLSTAPTFQLSEVGFLALWQ